MGFLRKIGRKIKKGVKKLFSSSLGSLVGGIALSMMFGPMVERVFQGGATAVPGKVGEEVGKKVAEEAGKKVAEEAGKKIVEKGAEQVATEAVKKEIVDSTVTGAVEKNFIQQLGTNLKEGAIDIGTGIKEFAVDPIGKTGKYLSGDFIPDVAQGVLGSVATQAIIGDPEEPFVSGGIMPQPAQEQAQNAYVQAVQSQVPSMQGMNFQQMNQSLLYGTLSPQYLMSQQQYG
jgi:flagellar hook-length control protein FliK